MSTNTIELNVGDVFYGVSSDKSKIVKWLYVRGQDIFKNSFTKMTSFLFVPCDDYNNQPMWFYPYNEKCLVMYSDAKNTVIKYILFLNYADAVRYRRQISLVEQLSTVKPMSEEQVDLLDKIIALNVKENNDG